MQRTSKFLYWLFPLLILIGVTLGFYGHDADVWRSVMSRIHKWIPSRAATPPAEAPAVPVEEKAAAPQAAPEAVPETALEKALAVAEQVVLPPSPPLPQVSPETGQEGRRAAFGLYKSIDYIVLRDEPFDVAGRQWTVRQMQAELLGIKDFQPLVPVIQEKDIGPSIRKPIHPSPSSAAHPIYYGIRVVRPNESLWHIHYALMREYLGRRQIDIPPDADRPLPDGRSSPVARVLKFFEGIVSIYDLVDVHAKLDIDEIRPFSMIIFFRISDLFTALDQVKPEDINRLRYIGNSLRLVHPEEARDLVDRKLLLEVPAEQ